MNMSLKIIFAGSSEFAIPSLDALIKSRHKILAVYTQPDRPAGRGRKQTPTPVKQFALQHNLPIHQPETLKNKQEQQILYDIHADIMIDVAYGLFLPKEVLNTFKYGCINVHPSLLPHWRGASPIQRAILAGNIETGVTVMQVDEGWDTGDILKQTKINIDVTDTTASMQGKLSKLGAKLVLKVLEDLEQDKLKPIPQDDTKSCYANKITKQEAQLDWQLSANELDRMIRAFNPWPVAFTKIDQQVLRIWKAIPSDTKTDKPPGTIVNIDKNSINVATGKGILRLLELQIPGGKILSASAMLNSKKELFKRGKCFHA
ncbi:MAG: methionyl-tRNA formyltransferase [Coxiella sp. DG_40]|nr:MAG: methionyl-tRNA formyltransferase [Coxiella sp. DG_40]